MKTRIAFAAVLLAAPFVSAQQGYYQVELASSGSRIAFDMPVAAGSKYVFHVYPSGTFVSVPQQEVKTIVPISTSAAEKTNPARQIVAIGNLAMEGGSAQGGRENASAWNAQRSAQTGTNPYDGMTWAREPANAVVASPGAPPMAPQ